MADEKKYRTEVPNIIDDLGLDPHERALYVHYKRACGGNDCEWVESIRITGQRTKMSFSRASMARKSLVNRGLIHLIPKGNDGTAVKIVNIWELNTIFYQQEDRPDIDGWTIERLTEWCQGVHIMNTINEERLKNEPETVGVHNMNGSVNNVNTSVHNMNNKKEPTKKEPKELSPNGDSGKPPAELASEKWNNANKKIVGDKFLELTRLPIPGNDRTRGNWWGWLYELFEMGKKDPAETCRLMAVVVEYMQHKHLTISSPKSLHNLARAVASGQELNGAQNGTPGKYGSFTPNDRPEQTRGEAAATNKLTAIIRSKSRGSSGSPGP